ncbi:hypothetical protein J437_LFUL013012 [Ladona fulva]|uniref:PiggyBac transposable element-derived protein domain-containing protein n=1 Tax=Ladona fulva TaxID=123851 RepID=A0A8K0KLP4_LADFU|nr:hypothetical protein J437_LFUL013012 [Ladona fulva]
MQLISRKGGLELVNKPICVIDYNKYVGGVDLKDQLIESFLLERKRTKVWYKKLFNHFVNTAVLNAYILFRKEGSKEDHLSFRIDLVNKIIALYHTQKLGKQKGRPSDTECTRLMGQHFIQEDPKTETFKVEEESVWYIPKVERERKLEDTEHAFLECPSFSKERDKLRCNLGIILTPEATVKQMLASEANWKAVAGWEAFITKTREVRREGQKGTRHRVGVGFRATSPLK